MLCSCHMTLVTNIVYLVNNYHWRRKRGGGGGGGGGNAACTPHLFYWGGQWYVCAPTFIHIFLFSTWIICLYNTDKQLFGIFHIPINISINWHRWLLLNNHISKYNLFILVLYRRYINYVSVCPPPLLFGTFLDYRIQILEALWVVGINWQYKLCICNSRQFAVLIKYWDFNTFLWSVIFIVIHEHAC